ncbi:hypothetical protein PMO31116_00150 [Pandoraea morbifera]|uniref:Transposase n=1 Tax=Pandoraea morbifera TaxID=2508300 RepID=A0A5E4RHH6_9BURK|nr:hypothetical protein PMO31116_00150 [Pandoraea morbifera]
MDAANAFIPEFIADHNVRFGKPPRNEHDAHRQLRADENLDLIFTWREPRCVSKSLTLQYDEKLYLLTETPETRKLASLYIEVYQYPDGTIELRANGAALPYTIYDRLSQVDQGAIVDNKRLGYVLQLAQCVQEKRDNRRSQSLPSASVEDAPRKRGRPPGKKSQRSLGQDDVLEALQRLQKREWPLDGTARQ